MCSTPFGIKDQFGRVVQLRRCAAKVLNAFRHQRSVRIMAIAASFVLYCAQRLSASKISSGTVRYPARNGVICAQRLSASKISSVNHWGNGPLSAYVLNAFRHQRSVRKATLAAARKDMCAQRLSASKISSGNEHQSDRQQADVLNAFRHQRSVRTRPFLA